MRQDGIRAARRTARALLHRFGVRAPEHVRIESFAKRLGASIVETRLDGASAQLLRRGDHVHILISDRIKDECARRFSIAHELGHYVLDHPSRPPSELCTQQPSRDGKGDERDHEDEANAFSGEMLMPEPLCRKICEVSPVSLEVPWRIAREYNVSILASAIRFAELASERCAAVFSVRGKVKWVAPSPTFTREIPRGQRVDQQSIAWDYFEKGDLDDRPQQVPATAWLRTTSDVEIIEHSIASKDLGTVLSMLWVPEASAPRLGMA